MAFTKYQKQAIAFQKGNCLVSAGAGSGKTAVLTERIYFLLVPPLDPSFAASYRAAHNGADWSPDDHDVDPVFLEGGKAEASPEELLVLTFSNAAAFEMKNRVREKLSAHEATHHLLAAIEKSDITTFDSFNLRLVNANHYALGLEKPVSIVDESFVKLLKKHLLDDVLAPYYERALAGEEETFTSFMGLYCAKNDDNLIDLVFSIMTMAELTEDPIAFLSSYKEKYLNRPFVESRFPSFEALIRERLKEAKALMEKEYEDPDLASLDIAFLDAALATSDYDSLVLALSSNFPRKPKGLEGRDVEIREAIKKNLIVPAKAMAKGSKEERIEEVLTSFPYVSLMVDLALSVERRLDEWMKENGSYTFSGVASLAGKAMQNEEIAARLRKQYRFLMVDEYQDTSDLQEAFLAKLEDENLFCVGDIKQSIYRFRHANPAIFAQRLRKYKANDGGTLITLPDNFRSREQVINDINSLFEQIMSENVGGVDYKEGHALAFGNHSFDKSKDASEFGASLLLFEPDPTLGESLVSARAIAKDIAYKVASGYKVKGKEGPRECEYGDFAVLISRKTNFHHYIRAFKEEGIPLFVLDSEDVKCDDIVYVIRALLGLIRHIRFGGNEDEEKTDILTLARSFLFEIPDEIIYQRFSSGDYRDFPFVRKLEEDIDGIAKMDMASLFLYFASEFDLPSRLLALGEVKENYEKYEAIASRAIDLESLGLGMAEFENYLDDLEANDGKFELKLSSREKGAAIMMSDHASKGLQFPICYYPELKAPFQGEKGSFLCSKEDGIVMPSVFESIDGESANATFLEFLVKTKAREEERSERMRLFYVALTRAEEAMVLLVPKYASIKGGEPQPFKAPLVSSSAKSFLDFLLLYQDSFPAIDADALPMLPKKAKKEKPMQDFSLSFGKVEIPSKKADRHRASKELVEPIDPAILVYGTKLHRYMEYLDLSKKDIPFLEEGREKEMLKKVLALPLFDHASEAKQFNEYEFLDEESGGVSIIDCFLLYDDHIDLIDFKTASLDEDAYSSQLGAYAKYLARAFPGRRIDKYLVSLTKAAFKLVD